MKMLSFIAVAATTMAAQADIITCQFTEPFVSSQYSMAQQTLKYESPFTGDNGKPEIKLIKNVSFQIVSAGVFELRTKDGKVLQTLTLTNNGSDGMSDIVYPYDVTDRGFHKSDMGGIGGCSSNLLKKNNPNK